MEKYTLFRVSFSSILTEWESLSSIPNRNPAFSGDSITIDVQNASNVFTWTSLESSIMPLAAILPLMRSSISLAALRVNVSMRTSLGPTSSLDTRFRYLLTMVCVFPVPGPASTTIMPSRVSAMRLCDSLSSLIGIILPVGGGTEEYRPGAHQEVWTFAASHVAVGGCRQGCRHLHEHGLMHPVQRVEEEL